MSHRTVHVDRVTAAATSPAAAAQSRLAASWRRSMLHHRLDPSENRAPVRHDRAEVARRIAAQGPLLTLAAPRLDRLYALVGLSGCAVFLTDPEGVILDHRAPEADAPVFDGWGLAPGADWSEAAEGTNGIGTCLTEGRRLVIHRDEHFLARNTAMSCIDAPIWGPDGTLAGALDVSSARVDQTEGFNGLLGAQVTRTARAIEEALFRAAFPRARILSAEEDDAAEAAVLLAVDADDLVIGATRAARRAFGLGPDRFDPRPAADLLGRDEGPQGFEAAERAALVRALARAGGNVSAAARALGVGRATLYRRMHRLGLTDQGADLSRS